MFLEFQNVIKGSSPVIAKPTCKLAANPCISLKQTFQHCDWMKILAASPCISLKQTFQHCDWMKILAESLRVDSINKWKRALIA